MPGSVSVTGISLDQGEQVDAVDREADDRDGAEHAVEDEQEERRRSSSPARPAMTPWRSACLPSVAETCDSEIRFSPIGSAPDWQLVGEVLRGGEREAAGDLGAVGRVDPFGVLPVVDGRHRDQLVVEDDREVLEACLAWARPAARAFSPRLAISLVTAFEDLAPVAREVEGHVRRALTAVFLNSWRGLVMSFPVSTGLSLSTYQLFVRASPFRVRRFFGERLHDDGAGVDVDRLQLRARAGILRPCRVRAGLGGFGAAQHRLVGFVEQVPLAVDAPRLRPARRFVLLRACSPGW